MFRTHLKNVFWPNIFVGVSFQILDNQQVACGLKLGSAAILNQNPIFETGSDVTFDFSGAFWHGNTHNENPALSHQSRFFPP